MVKDGKGNGEVKYRKALEEWKHLENGNIWSGEERNNWEVKGRSYLVKDIIWREIHIWSMEDKKNDEEKGGKSIGEGKGHAQTNRHVGERPRSLDSLFAKIHHHHHLMSMIQW